jgi:hypothetical protein
MNAWWWLSVPYSVTFPLLVLILRVKESVGHAAALFLVVSILTTLSSVVWAFVMVRQLTTGREKLTLTKRVKLGFVLLTMLLWAILFTGPR